MKPHEYEWMLKDKATRHWRESAAQGAEPFKAECLNSYAATGNFHPDALIDYGYQSGPVLDFGCGPGRNVKLLLNRFPSVTGYDMPEACATMPENVRGLYERLTSGWPVEGPFSCIYAALVLQHIREPWLRCYLEDFQKTSDLLHLTTRWYNDDGTAVLKTVFDYYLPVDPEFSIAQALRERVAPEDQTWFRLLLKSRKATT